jgi:hypothetical protein
MQDLELLDDEYALTHHGNTLARAFSGACKPDPSGKRMLPKSACLSRITRHEGALLEARLGVRKKGKTSVDDTSTEARRGALERELRPLFNEGLSLPTVLAAYETRPDREPSLTIGALREAAVWERLSVGLHATFLHGSAYPLARDGEVDARVARRKPKEPRSIFRADLDRRRYRHTRDPIGSAGARSP